MRSQLLVFMLLGTLLAPGCGESSADSQSASGSDSEFGGSGGADASDAADGSDAGDAIDLPPETETTALLPQPAAGESHVFIPSAVLDAVVRINAQTLAVTLLDAGIDPAATLRVDGDDGVSILAVNAGSDDVSLFRQAEAEVPAEPVIIDLPTPANRAALSPDNRYAITWRAPDAGEGSVGLGSLQDVTLLRLDTPGAVSVGVGFRPSAVTYFGDAAFVLSDSGVSRIALDAPFEARFAAPVAMTDDPLEPARDREVVILDATTAAVRRAGKASVRFVSLVDGSAREVPLDGIPSDLDVTLGGAEVLAVLRAQGALVRVPADGGEPTVIPLGDLPAGQAEVSEDGERAVAFTSVVTDAKGEATAVGNEWLVIVDLAGDAPPRVVPLIKGVASVALSPDGRRAVVVHDRHSQGDADRDAVDARVDLMWGFSVVDLASGYAKLELTASQPLGVLVNDARAIVLVGPGNGSPGGALDVDLAALQVGHVDLGSPPSWALDVGARTAILQDHAAGRVTFLDHATGTAETVTGFQLNSKIK